MVILLLPKPWLLPFKNLSQSIFEVELNSQVIETETQVLEDPTTQPVIPPIDQLKQNVTQTSSAPNTPTKQLTPEPILDPTQSVKKADNTSQSKNVSIAETSTPAKVVTSGDILLSANNRTSIQVPLEFQARTEDKKNFYIPQQEIESWLADIPFLDESVDRPTIQMKFYAEGIEGSIEKFFDKITISKTFTTKYGTKIHCALIGVIAACGWK